MLCNYICKHMYTTYNVHNDRHNNISVQPEATVINVNWIWMIVTVN